MSKRNLINLVLLAIVGILVLIVVYEPGKDQKQTPPLTNIDKQSIRKIHITRTGQAPVTLQRSIDQSGQPEKWMMVEPFAVQANAIKTESLLTLLNQESLAKYPLANLDEKTYGLDKPRASITFNDNLVFEFGGTEPLNKNRYLRHDGHLYVINDHFYYQLMSPVTVFVDHQILAGLDHITKLVLPEFSLTLHDGSWQLTPAREDFSNDQANELIENWKVAHAMQISEYKAKTKTQQVHIYTNGNDTPVNFDIIMEGDDFYLGRADLGLKYQIAKDNQRELLQLPPKIETPVIDEKPAPQTNTDADN